jgi:hypothetical protein
VRCQTQARQPPQKLTGIAQPLRKFAAHLTQIFEKSSWSREPRFQVHLLASELREKWDRREMMFLLRTAFWLTLVLVLLPSGRSEPVGGPQLAAADAVSAASAAVSDMREFCTRQQNACAFGSQAATAIGHRAQAGAKMVYEFLTERAGPNQPGTATPGGSVTETAYSAVVTSQDTLSAADIAHPWREPLRRDAQSRHIR